MRFDFNASIPIEVTIRGKRKDYPVKGKVDQLVQFILSRAKGESLVRGQISDFSKRDIGFRSYPHHFNS